MKIAAIAVTAVVASIGAAAVSAPRAHAAAPKRKTEEKTVSTKATLRYFEGDVKVNGTSVPAGKTDTVIEAGATITTGPKPALALVELPEGSRIKLQEMTKIVFKETGDTNPPTVEAVLESGGMFTKVEPNWPWRKFMIRAKQTTMGVRGTLFYTGFGRNDDVWMCVNEGKVEISAGKRSEEIVAGKGVVVKRSTDLGDVRSYPWTQKLNWNFDAAGDLHSNVDLKAMYE